MKNVKTQAFPITEETYSLAVALLPPVFATLPLSKVMGCWVIINKFRVANPLSNNLLDKAFGGDQKNEVLTLHNSWVSQEDFSQLYTSEESQTPVRVVLNEITQNKF